jgi:ATP-dependent DNA helicase RecG
MDPEGRQIEYKEMLQNYRSIIRTAVAFSNDIGGKIVVGVRDRSLEIVGLDEEEIERYLEELPQAIYDSISPSCIPHLNTILMGDRTVLEIHIFQGGKKPYYVKSEGIPKGVYLRVGPHTKRVQDDILGDLFRQGKNRSWDDEVMDGAGLSSLDSQSLRAFYGETWTEDQLIADKVLKISPLGEKGISHSGVLFFNSQPHRLIPQQEILFTHFSGRNQDSVVTTHDLSAPLPILAEQTLELLKPHLAVSTELSGLKFAPNAWQVPIAALREALLNALIHRNYVIPDAIKVALFSDRIEVFSPGNFPGPMDLKNLGNGISYSRNPNLRHLARKANLVEKRGFGFRLILSECRKNGNPPPEVIEGPHHVKVVFSRKHTHLDIHMSLPDRYERLSVLRGQGKPFQVREAAAALGVSHGTARARLKELIDSGWLKQTGSGRGSYYEWIR